VTLTTVAERIVHPGQAAEYMRHVHDVFERLRQPGRASRLLVVVSDDNPDHVLSLGEWDDLPAAGEAYYRIPKQLTEAADALVAAQPSGLFRLYTRLRSVERMLERGRYLVAIRLRVAPDDAARFEEWARGLFDRGLVGPRVVAVRLMRAQEEPGGFLAIAERSDQGTGQLAEFLARNPPPVPLLEHDRFVGRIDGLWEPATPLPTATQPLTPVR
jgi:quinol monooxygenase YgiN